MRILLIRTSALGDIVHCLPALRGLRERFPEARVGWVVEEVFAPLLERDPDLDEVLCVRLREWRKSPLSRATLREIAASLGEIRAFEADVVLDLMGNHKAGALAALSSCDRRIGLRRSQRREPSSAVWLSELVSARGPHAVERALSVAAAAGAAYRFVGFGSERIRRGAMGLASPAGDYAVIHPGAAWADKRYPPQRWGEVAARLASRLGWNVLLSAGPGEEALAREVERSSGGVARCAEASSVPALVALLAGARMALGGDTGPLHLAHALDVPTLFLHGPTDPLVHGPYGAPERALRARPSLTELEPGVVVERALQIAARSDSLEASSSARTL